MLKRFKTLGIVGVISLFTTIQFVTPVFSSTTSEDSFAMVKKNSRLFYVSDNRVLKLTYFFKSQNSPLGDYALDFVQIADKYGVDWRLVPAISGVESSFGKYIPASSYNAYGWNNGNYYFQNWPEGIETVTFALKENYIKRGANTVEKIAPSYAPPSRNWAWKVKYFMAQIKNSPNETLFLPFTL